MTITDPGATRYFMTVLEACSLVILSAALVKFGCIYLLDMGKPVRIKDLALKMMQAYKPHVASDIPKYIFNFVRQWDLVGSAVKMIDREALLYSQIEEGMNNDT